MRVISIENLFSEIESADFYSNLVFINKFNSLLIFLESNSTVEELIDFIRSDETYLDLAKERITKLWNFDCDENKLHPYDYSIAIYIYIIFRAYKDEIKPVLEFIYKNRLKNLWWTYEMYNYILKNLPKASVSSTCETFEASNSDNIDIIDIKSSDSA